MLMGSNPSRRSCELSHQRPREGADPGSCTSGSYPVPLGVSTTVPAAHNLRTTGVAPMLRSRVGENMHNHSYRCVLAATTDAFTRVTEGRSSVIVRPWGRKKATKVPASYGARESPSLGRGSEATGYLFGPPGSNNKKCNRARLAPCSIYFWVLAFPCARVQNPGFALSLATDQGVEV